MDMYFSKGVPHNMYILFGVPWHHKVWKLLFYSTYNFFMIMGFISFLTVKTSNTDFKFHQFILRMNKICLSLTGTPSPLCSAPIWVFTSVWWETEWVLCSKKEPTYRWHVSFYEVCRYTYMCHRIITSRLAVKKHLANSLKSNSLSRPDSPLFVFLIVLSLHFHPRNELF